MRLASTGRLRLVQTGFAPAILGSALIAACLLPSEPSTSSRIEFRLEVDDPYPVPLAGTARPAIEVLAGGSVLPAAPYRLESLDESIVRIDASGQALTGVRRGDAQVRVVYPSATGAPDTVFRAQVVVARIDVSTPAPESPLKFTRLGDSTPLSAAAFDAEGLEVPELEFEWWSSAPAVASVSSTGVVTAVDEGTAFIHADVDGVSGTARVTVVQVAAAVRIAPELDSIRTVGRSVQLVAVAFDSTLGLLRNARARWTSENEAVATVDASGLATATGSGTVRIIGRVGEAADTATLVVSQVLRYLVVAPAAPTLTAIADTVRMVPVGSDSLGTPIPDLAVSWTTTDPAVATVDATGLVSAVGNGPVVVTASSGAVNGLATVVVRQEVVAARIAEDNVTLTAAGDTARLTAIAVDRNGYEVVGAGVTWRSTDACVATVAADGVLTALDEGTTLIIATPPGGGTADTSIALVATSGVPPSVPGRAEIAFETNRGIEAITPGGCGRRLVIANTPGVTNSDPTWSPDGEHLAFTRMTRDGAESWTSCQIYRARADGSDVRELTPRHDPCSLHPAWSPDGLSIAFAVGDARCYDACELSLTTISADGLDRTVRLRGDWFANPTWSPDGSTLTFEAWPYGAGASGYAVSWITLAGAAKGQPDGFHANGSEPSWSPDGSQLAYVADGDIWIMNADGSGTRNLTSTPAPTYESQPAWSPDGQRLVFVGADTSCEDWPYPPCIGQRSHLYAISRDGTGRVRLTSPDEYALKPAWRPRP